MRPAAQHPPPQPRQRAHRNLQTVSHGRAPKQQLAPTSGSRWQKKRHEALAMEPQSRPSPPASAGPHSSCNSVFGPEKSLSSLKYFPLFWRSLRTKQRHEGYRAEGREAKGVGRGQGAGERGGEGARREGEKVKGLHSPEHLHSGGVTPLSKQGPTPTPLSGYIIAGQRESRPGNRVLGSPPSPDASARGAAHQTRAQGPQELRLQGL